MGIVNRSSPLEHLTELMEAALPGIGISLDPPADLKKGAWHLDLSYEGKREVVLWIEAKGFGLWDFEPVYTEHPSVFFPADAIVTVRDKLIDKLARRSASH